MSKSTSKLRWAVPRRFVMSVSASHLLCNFFAVEAISDVQCLHEVVLLAVAFLTVSRVFHF